MRTRAVSRPPRQAPSTTIERKYFFSRSLSQDPPGSSLVAVVVSCTPVVVSGIPVVVSGTSVVVPGTPVVVSGNPVVVSGTVVVVSGNPVVVGTPMVVGTPDTVTIKGMVDTRASGLCSVAWKLDIFGSSRDLAEYFTKYPLLK